MSRTLVRDYQYPRDYKIFKLSVMTAYRTALHSMALHNINIAILARISGGIYSGLSSPTNIQINIDYDTIINEILMDDHLGSPLYTYFDEVILTV
jgi:hypothetical protein